MRTTEQSTDLSQDDFSPSAVERLVRYEEAKANGTGAAIEALTNDAAREELACVDLLHHVWPDLAPAATGHDDPPPTTLGDFRLLREIGRGGMGTVFEAEQMSMGRHVALKVLPFAALVQEKSLQRFRNEVRAAAALDHPNIVSVYSIGEERGVHFYAMQLVRGQTLADLIGGLRHCREKSVVSGPLSVAKTTDLPATDHGQRTTDTQPVAALSTIPVFDSREHFRAAARLGIQAAEALQHAHDLGVLHRDIKPSNLLVDQEGKLYVTDFGLARTVADAGLTMTGDIVGTLRYMAPEQALAKRVVIDQRADVYSLGSTLYELLTLQPAFGETDRSELLKQIAFDEPRQLRKLDRRIPVELETIVLRAMAKDIAQRYQIAQDLADDLRAFLEHRPIVAKPQQRIRRVARWTRSKAGTLAVAAILLVVLVRLTFQTQRAYPGEAKYLLTILAQVREDAEAARDTPLFAQANDRLLKWAKTADRVSWSLATAASAELRNGSLAVELAENACEITQYKDEQKLGTLAAAYAETGDFDSAIKWSIEALRYGPQRNSNSKLLWSFLNSTPWRQ